MQQPLLVLCNCGRYGEDPYYRACKEEAENAGWKILAFDWDVAFRATHCNKSESCTCATIEQICFRNTVLEHSANDGIIIAVSTSARDECIMLLSDIIIAFNAASAWCNEHRVPHYNAQSFFDVKMILQKKLLHSTIRERRQARIARTSVFECE